MTTRICKFGCQTPLSGWDDNARKYIEAGSGGLHTRERCEELKAQLAAKNNHGNEDVGDTTTTTTVKGWIPTKEQAEQIAKETQNYVDHTQGIKEKLKLKMKIFTDPTAEGLMLAYNSFAETHNIKYSQYQPVNALYTIAVYFEEISK